MGKLLDLQKQTKHQSLIDAAYELFKKQGTVKTSINDIVARAKVAKGTFYLYFRDKEDILQALADKLSYRILSEAYEHMDKNRTDDFADNVILLIDYIVEYFKTDKLTLQMLERKFSWPIFKDEIMHSDDALFCRIKNDLRSCKSLLNKTDDELFKFIFIIIEMCGSVCYSSIIKNKPDNIDNMKPVLYAIIRKNLT